MGIKRTIKRLHSTKQIENATAIDLLSNSQKYKKLNSSLLSYENSYLELGKVRKQLWERILTLTGQWTKTGEITVLIVISS